MLSMRKKKDKRNIWKIKCYACDGFAQKENPAYTSYQRAMDRGECPTHIPNMYNICNVCGGTGESNSSLGTVVVEGKAFIAKVLHKVAESFEK